MNSFIKSTPIVLILILCSSNSYSEPVRLEKSQIKFQSSNNLKSIGFKLDSSSNSFPNSQKRQISSTSPRAQKPESTPK